MRIAVAGASGLIGAALVGSLQGDSHDVVRLVRREPSQPDEVRWDPTEGADTQRLQGIDALVNLAGAGVGDRRWSAGYKRIIRESRIQGTATLARAAAELDPPPQVLVNGGAIGYYGETGDQPVDEAAPPGRGFLAELCAQWEAAAEPARAAGVRTVTARTGIVLAAGGVLGPLLPLFRLGLGGRLGSGRQYWSFISLRDEVAALRHLLDTADLSGPVNLTAPHPATNREVTAALARALHRPAVLPVPGFALRVAIGEVASDALGSQRVVPKRLLESGFTFTDPSIDDAVHAALS